MFQISRGIHYLVASHNQSKGESGKKFLMPGNRFLSVRKNKSYYGFP